MSYKTLTAWIVLAIFLGLMFLKRGQCPAAVAPIDLEPSIEVSLFQKACLPSDNQALLSLLEHHSDSSQTLASARRLIIDLGSDTFDRREQADTQLREMGTSVQSLLKENVNHSDREIATRVRRLLIRLIPFDRLDPIAKNALPRAAIRLLIQRRAEGAIGALLRFLPRANSDEQVEIYFGLNALVKDDPKGKSGLVAALKDTEPARRAVAACILARIGDDSQRAITLSAVKDVSPLVRLRAAQGALAGGVKERAVLPALIALLDRSEVEYTWQAEELLRYVAGDGAPLALVGANTEDERKTARLAWEAWWKTKGKTLDLTRLDEGPRRPGLVLIYERGADYLNDAESLLWIAGCDGLPRFSIEDKLHFRSSVFRPNGRILALMDTPSDKGASPGCELVERSLDGKVIWKKRFPGIAGKTLRLLPNGNCLLSDRDAVHQLNQTGQSVNKINTGVHHFRQAQVGWDGTVVSFDIASKDGVYHIVNLIVDPKTVRERQIQVKPPIPLDFIGEAILLADGGFLVSANLWSKMELVAGDRHGRHRSLNNRGLLPVTRLPNGNTLARMGSIVEIEADGRWVWEASARGKIGISNAEVIYPLLRFGFARPSTEAMNVRSATHLLRAMKSRDSITRRHAASALCGDQIRDAATHRRVVEYLRDPDDEIRKFALDYIRLDPKRVATIMPELIRLFDDKEIRIANETGHFLSALGAEVVPILIQAASDSNRSMKQRKGALKALGSYALSGNATAVKSVRDWMKGKETSLRIAAIQGVGRTAFKRNVFVPDLLRLVEDKDRKVAHAACSTLGWLKTKESIPTLIRKLEDTQFRSTAAHALYLIGAEEKNPVILEALLRYSGPEEELNYRAYLMVWLSSFGPEKKVVTALIRALDDVRVDERGTTPEDRTPVRSTAIEILLRFGAGAKAAVPALSVIVKDPKAPKQIRQIAFAALSKIDPERSFSLKDVVPK